MRVHQLPRGFWELEPALTLGCKRLRPISPTDDAATISSAAFDLKNFIRPESGSRKHTAASDDKRDHSLPQVETHPGGTRWNPTQEQIGILEMLYRRGMRTPNAQQIEHITAQLSHYGKIEGKNVFYWFQNHKARERQKQKRNSLALAGAHSPKNTPPQPMNLDIMRETEREANSTLYKRTKSWGYEMGMEVDVDDRSSTSSTSREDLGDRTLELFPLHPEGSR